MPEIWASTPGTFCTSAERTCRWTVLGIEKAENLLWGGWNNRLAVQPQRSIIILGLKSSKGSDLRLPDPEPKKVNVGRFVSPWVSGSLLPFLQINHAAEGQSSQGQGTVPAGHSSRVSKLPHPPS